MFNDKDNFIVNNSACNFLLVFFSKKVVRILGAEKRFCVLSNIKEQNLLNVLNSVTYMDFAVETFLQIILFEMGVTVNLFINSLPILTMIPFNHISDIYLKIPAFISMKSYLSEPGIVNSG